MSDKTQECSNLSNLCDNDLIEKITSGDLSQADIVVAKDLMIERGLDYSEIEKKQVFEANRQKYISKIFKIDLMHLTAISIAAFLTGFSGRVVNSASIDGPVFFLGVKFFLGLFWAVPISLISYIVMYKRRNKIVSYENLVNTFNKLMHGAAFSCIGTSALVLFGITQGASFVESVIMATILICLSSAIYNKKFIAVYILLALSVIPPMATFLTNPIGIYLQWTTSFYLSIRIVTLQNRYNLLGLKTIPDFNL